MIGAGYQEYFQSLVINHIVVGSVNQITNKTQDNLSNLISLKNCMCPSLNFWQNYSQVIVHSEGQFMMCGIRNPDEGNDDGFS